MLQFTFASTPIATAALLASLLMSGCGEAPPMEEPDPHGAEQGVLGEGWLLGADDDRERFERLESYLGGFSAAMWEVGERYRSVHEALQHENYELASYHWEKIKDAVEGGYMKRPARRENAETLFLDTLWGEVAEAFESDDAERAWSGFSQAREGCIACHVAEDVPFMNEQPLFTELDAP